MSITKESQSRRSLLFENVGLATFLFYLMLGKTYKNTDTVILGVNHKSSIVRIISVNQDNFSRKQ